MVVQGEVNKWKQITWRSCRRRVDRTGPDDNAGSRRSSAAVGKLRSWCVTPAQFYWCSFIRIWNVVREVKGWFSFEVRTIIYVYKKSKGKTFYRTVDSKKTRKFSYFRKYTDLIKEFSNTKGGQYIRLNGNSENLFYRLNESITTQIKKNKKKKKLLCKLCCRWNGFEGCRFKSFPIFVLSDIHNSKVFLIKILFIFFPPNVAVGPTQPPPRQVTAAIFHLSQPTKSSCKKFSPSPFLVSACSCTEQYAPLFPRYHMDLNTYIT